METLFKYNWLSFSSEVFLINNYDEIAKHDFIITDSNTQALLPTHIAPSFVIPSGEKEKNLQTVEHILTHCLSLGLVRNSSIIGFGGGVVCDITAFVASLYMRGISLSLIPTTLLSMVDAGLGGKCGVDFEGYKNLVGSFYPAQKIFIFPQVLTSLPEREYYSGLAEVLKHGMLSSSSLISELENNIERIKNRDISYLTNILPQIIKVKGDIISRDLYEKGERAFLNLGHTFAHALETITNFSYTLGEAVAWGIGRALILSKLLNLIDESYYKRSMKLLLNYNFELNIKIDNISLLIETMEKDKKKKKEEGIQFVLQRDLGDTFQMSIERNKLIETLNYIY